MQKVRISTLFENLITQCCIRASLDSGPSCLPQTAFLVDTSQPSFCCKHLCSVLCSHKRTRLLPLLLSHFLFLTDTHDRCLCLLLETCTSHQIAFYVTHVVKMIVLSASVSEIGKHVRVSRKLATALWLIRAIKCLWNLEQCDICSSHCHDESLSSLTVVGSV